jgi:hypothetical protein
MERANRLIVTIERNSQVDCLDVRASEGARVLASTLYHDCNTQNTTPTFLLGLTAAQGTNGARTPARSLTVTVASDEGAKAAGACPTVVSIYPHKTMSLTSTMQKKMCVGRSLRTEGSRVRRGRSSTVYSAICLRFE